MEDTMSSNIISRWVEKIDNDHSEAFITLETDSPVMEARYEAMSAAMKAVEAVGGRGELIFGERAIVQLVFCITYTVTFLLRK